jgi:hypothetical protein
MRLVSGVGSSFVVMSLRQRVVAVLAVVALSVTGTLIVVELTKSDRIVLPPGCSAADRGSPGCRPVTESGADVGRPGKQHDHYGQQTAHQFPPVSILARATLSTICHACNLVRTGFVV